MHVHIAHQSGVREYATHAQPRGTAKEAVCDCGYAPQADDGEGKADLRCDVSLIGPHAHPFCGAVVLCSPAGHLRGEGGLLALGAFGCLGGMPPLVGQVALGRFEMLARLLEIRIEGAGRGATEENGSVGAGGGKGGRGWSRVEGGRMEGGKSRARVP